MSGWILAAGPAWAQFGSAVYALRQSVGARQHGMGGAGVALPDAAQGMNWNPALPGMSFPRDRKSVLSANAWANIGEGPEWGYRDQDLPLDFGYGSLPAYLPGYPGRYFPRVGYAGLDRQAFNVDGIPGFREHFHALTLATAPDFLVPPGVWEKPGWEWTFGVTAKWFESGWPDYRGGRDEATGPVVDLGWAGRAIRIPYLPGVEAVAGAALLNLGGPVFYGDAGSADPLPEQWRLGWSLAWRPLPSPAAGGTWHPLEVTLTQELHREFHGRHPDGDPRAFPGSLVHDLFGRTGTAWRERITHMGAEIVLAGVASLRVGRHHEGYWRGYPGAGTAYAWGYGLSTGPWLGRFAVRWDFARYFRTVSVRPMTLGTLHQKTLQIQYSW